MTRHLLLFITLATTPTLAQDMPLSQVLIPGEDWQLLGEGYQFTEGPAAAPDGTVYFTDVRDSKIYKISPAGEVSLFVEDSAKTNGLYFGPDGKLYGCRNGDQQIVIYHTADGSHVVIAEGFGSNDLVVDAQGGIYVTEPRPASSGTSPQIAANASSPKASPRTASSSPTTTAPSTAKTPTTAPSASPSAKNAPTPMA